MIKTLFNQFGNIRATTKVDVAIGVVGAILAIGHAVDTANRYKTENESTTEENTNEAS